MGRRFRGESDHKVDSKGRVSIPALFRRVLETEDPGCEPGDNPELVIVYGDESRNYLECYTLKAIDEVDDKIDALPRSSQERKDLERMVNGQSYPTSVDDTGRLVLPAKLRNKIGLTDKAFFIAAGDTFEIWKPETYAAEQMGGADRGDPMIHLDGIVERARD